MNRTLKESSDIIAKCIAEIRATPDNITDELIEKSCIKYDVDEDRIRKIALLRKRVSY
jgi:hypothetical protein